MVMAMASVSFSSSSLSPLSAISCTEGGVALGVLLGGQLAPERFENDSGGGCLDQKAVRLRRGAQGCKSTSNACSGQEASPAHLVVLQERDGVAVVGLRCRLAVGARWLALTRGSGVGCVARVALPVHTGGRAEPAGN